MCVSSLEVPKPIKASTGFLLKLSISRSFGCLILKHRMLRLAQSPVITWKTQMLLVSKRLCAAVNYAFSPSCRNTFSFQVFDSCGFTSFQIPPKKARTFLGVIFHGFRVCSFFSCTKSVLARMLFPLRVSVCQTDTSQRSGPSPQTKAKLQVSTWFWILLYHDFSCKIFTSSKTGIQTQKTQKWPRNHLVVNIICITALQDDWLLMTSSAFHFPKIHKSQCFLYIKSY